MARKRLGRAECRVDWPAKQVYSCSDNKKEEPLEGTGLLEELLAREGLTVL